MDHTRTAADIAAHVKTAAARRGMSEATLSRASDIPPSTLRRPLHGATEGAAMLTVNELATLAHVFNMRPADLIAGREAVAA